MPLHEPVPNKQLGFRLVRKLRSHNGGEHYARSRTAARPCLSDFAQQSGAKRYSCIWRAFQRVNLNFREVFRSSSDVARGKWLFGVGC
jgi:hypothetical protein